MEITNDRLKNDYCVICFKEETKPYIIGRDLTDLYNDLTFFTRNVQGLQKCWDYLKNNFNENQKMRDIKTICDQYKLKTHSYCAMD